MQFKNQGGLEPLTLEGRMMKEVHLGQDHWNNIPETASLNYQHNHSPKNIKYKTDNSNIHQIIRNLIFEFLTHRQFQVFDLYWLDHKLTQIQIAEKLGISQPTVNQHLNGKIRNGKRIGGANRRIRKRLSTFIKNTNELPEYTDCLDFFEMMSREDS